MSLRDTFSRDGYVLAAGLYPRETVGDVKRQIHAVVRRRIESLGRAPEASADGTLSADALYRFFEEDADAYIGCMMAIQNLRASFALCAHPPLVALLEELGIACPAFSTKPIIMLNSPRTARSEAHWKVPPHQDWRSIQGSLNGMVLWIALDDVPPERGPLEVIPGSHRWGLLTSVRDDWYRHVVDPRVTDDAFSPVPVHAGDAVLFSGFLVHRSGVNDGRDIRYSLQLRFNDLLEPTFVERGYPSTYVSDRPVRDFVEEGTIPEIEFSRGGGDAGNDGSAG